MISHSMTSDTATLRIVLVRPKASANVGACARAMKNFGLDSLYLVAPQCQRDRQAYALASHAGDVLDKAVVCSQLSDALQDVRYVLATSARTRASDHPRYTPRSAMARYNTATANTAILFGPEDFGLSNDDLKHCQGLIHIPTSAYASLNLAHAVQVIAYEHFISQHEPDAPHTAASQASAADAATPLDSPHSPENLAPREQYEAMYQQLIGMLERIGYTDAQRSAHAEQLFRRIFDRAQLDARELAALRGLWRQTLWAAEQSPETLSKTPPA